jgi:4-amino-4-deoxy-L-arabinose transferase-like glycosyltransferase
MIRLMPTALIIPITAILGLVRIWPRLHTPMSSWRLVAKVLVSALASIWWWTLVWVLYWTLERGW